MNSDTRHPGLVWHASCLLGLWVVVFGFANLFPLWSLAAAKLGQSVAAGAPFAVVFLLLVATAWRGWRQRQRGKPRIVALVLGGLFAVAALGLTDPAFPAKRIHVAEYATLAVLVRAYMVRFISGGWLAGLSAVTAAVYGIHDEMIQGLLPERTFGIRDVVVNGVSALAGSLLAHGLGLFGRGGDDLTVSAGDAAKITLVTGSLAAGIVALLAPLPYYRDILPPVWTILPILIVVPISAAVGELASVQLRIALDVLVVVAVLTALYPMMPYVTPLGFR